MKAQKYGIAIPETIIGRNFSEFSHEYRYVTKNLQDVFSYSTDCHYVSDSVKEVDLSERSANDTFFYSLFQKKISSIFEIRTFFFMDLWYSLAIFPAKTVDYREQVYQSPPRMVPVKLPIEYKKKLQELMIDLDLNSGSIDTLYDGKEYYFLEVNPVGQFDFVSGIGNYYIERDIALKLKQLDENEQ